MQTVLHAVVCICSKNSLLYTLVLLQVAKGNHRYAVVESKVSYLYTLVAGNDTDMCIFIYKRLKLNVINVINIGTVCIFPRT